MDKVKKILITYRTRLLILLPILILLIGSSYAFLSLTLTTTKINTLAVGKLSLKLDDDNSKEINLDNAEPVTDEIGLKYSPYTFTITNDGNINSEYTIYLDDLPLSDGEERLTDNYVKYSLIKDDKVIATQLLSETGINPNRVLDIGVIKPGEVYTYKLKVWVDVNAPNEAQNKVFLTQIRVEGLQETNKISDKPFNNTNIGDNGNIDASDSEIFITGTNPNNYVWYSGILWRIISKDTNNNSVKLVSQWNLSAVPYTSSDKNSFSGSYVEEWLNDTGKDGFLGNLYDYSKFIKTDSNWNVTKVDNNSKPNNTNMVTKSVGLLNIYEYSKTHGNISPNNGYLNNGLQWWSISSNNSGNIYYIGTDGSINTSNSSTNSFGIRPSINLKGDVHVSGGTGTLNDPYTLLGDNKAVTNSSLNKRHSGEYVKFDNNTYRIVNVSNNNTKIVSTTDVSNLAFDSTGSSLFNTLSINNIGNYLNTTWYNSLSDNYKNMIVTGDWYLGTVTDSHYGFAKCSNTGVDCQKDQTSVNARVGLIRLGELMSGQYSNNASSYFTLTPYSSTNINYINSNGTLSNGSVNNLYGVRPALYLDSSVYIIGGRGTWNDPYIISTSKDSSSVNKYVASFIKSTNVISIDTSSLSCKFIAGESDSCDIVLPSITAPKGYDSFWTLDESATSGLNAFTSIKLSSNVTYYAKAFDITVPLWNLDKVTTSNNESTIHNGDTVTIKFSGTDSSGIVNSYLTVDNIKIMLDDKEVVPTSKTLSKKTTINDGYQYTLTLAGLSGYGNLSIVIDEHTLIDQSGNMSSSTILDSKILVDAKDKFTATFTKGDYVSSIGSAGLSCEAIDSSGCGIQLPTITVPTGYTVLGWYDSNDVKVGNAGDSYTLTENVILTAKAIPNSYTVTYDYSTNGGSSSTKTTDTVYYNENVDLGVIATKDGYTFVGWNTDKNATDKLNELVMGTGNITLYAIYKKTVTANFYYYNGAGQDMAQNSCTIYNKASDSSCVFELPQVVSNSVGINSAVYEGVSKDVSSTTAVSAYNAGISTKYYAFYKGSWTVNYTKDSGISAIGSTVNTCTSYKTSNGSDYSSSSCNVTLPTITASTGYTALGWYLESSKVGNAGDIYIVSSNDNLIAKSNINSYTVTYDYSTNGGTSATKTSDTVNYGAAIDLTPTASKDGYEFVGWNTNKDATSKLGSLEMGTSNITLYAIFKKEAVTLTAKFNANGATLSSTDNLTCTIPAVYNNTAQATSCQVTAPTITRDGYTIVGYNTTASAKTNNSSYASGKITLTTNNNNSTWYAITSKAVSATFYYYNGSSQATTSTSCTMYNKETSCSYSVPSAVSSSSGPNSTTYQGVSASASSTTLTTTYNSNTTKYYAVYQTGITATFYYYNGSAQATTTASGTRTATTNGTSYTTAQANLSVPSVVSSSTGPSSAAYKGVSSSVSSTTTTTPTTGATKYYAVYQGTWTLNYAKGSGVSSIGSTQANCTSNKTTNGTTYSESTCSVTLPSITASTGYTVLGWYNSGNTKVGNAGASYTISKTETLTSKTNINSYTVTYDYSTNGGSSATKTSATVNYGAAIDLTPTASKDGYEFVGWNTNKDATSKLESLEMGTSNITLFAVYKKTVTATFYYYNNQSTTISSTVYNKTTNATITLPNLLNKTVSGVTYSARGWSASTAANATTITDTSVSISDDTSYYASYSAEITGTFYYSTKSNTSYTYSDIPQSSATATAIKYMNYKGSYINSNFTVPTVVSSSSGGAAAEEYKGVSTSANSATMTTPTTANTQFFAVYTEPLTLYYYDGTNKVSKTVTRRALSGGANSTYSLSISEDVVPSSYNGVSFAGWTYVNNDTSSSSIRTPVNTGVDTLYAYYRESYTATFYYYNGSAQASTTASANRDYVIASTSTVNTINSNISVPSAVSSSSGPNSTTYKGVSKSTGSTTSTTPVTGTSKYYAYYQASITATFYYYDGSAQASTTASGTRTATTNGTTYSTAQGSISVPSAVSSSSGPSSTTYKGVSSAAGSTTSVTPTTANTKYYAYYQATITATFYYYDGSAQASTTASGTRKAKTDGTTYSTVQGSISVPSVVSSSTGPNSTTYKGVSSSTSSTTAATPTTANTKYYAYYQGDWTAFYSKGTGVSAIGATSNSCTSNKTTDGTTYSSSTCSVTLPTITASTGYTVAGWYSGSTKVGNASASYTLSSDVSLVAKGTANQYTVSYNSNGGTTGSMSSQTATYNSSFTVSSNGFGKTGYTFAGWTTNSDGTDDGYGWTDWSGTWKYVNGQNGISGGKLVLYARWTPNTYTVSYDSNGGSGSMSSQTATYDSSITLNNNTFTKTGYTFAGWSEEVSNLEWTKGFVKQDGTIVDSISAWPDSYYSSLIYLKSGITYTVSGFGDYGCGGNSSCVSGVLWRQFDSSGKYLGSADALSFTPSQDCYVRILFYIPSTAEQRSSTVVTSNSSSVLFTNGQTINNNLVAAYNSTVKLKAVWKVNSYTVTYDYSTNGGSSATKTSAKVNYNASIDLTPTASKDGYTFVGWNTNKSATSALSSLKMGTSNVTLYAIYKKTVTATFYYYNNQSSTSSSTVYNNTTNATIALPTIANQTVDGFTYSGRGWSTSTGANATTVTGTSVSLSANKTYYASYSREVTATFYYSTQASTGYTYSNIPQSSTTATAVKYMNYKGSYVNSTFTVPDVVSSSSGGAAAEEYQGVAYQANSADIITPTTAHSQFFAVYTEPLTLYYYDGTSNVSKTITRRVLSNGTSSNYNTSVGEDVVPSSYNGVSFTGWSYKNTEVNARTPITIGVDTLYAYYRESYTATFYYYNGSAQASTTASANRDYVIASTSTVNTINSNISVPSAVSSSTGPNSTTYKGVSKSTGSTTAATPVTGTSKYYAYYQASITATFYYYDGSAQASTTASGIRTATTDGTTYSTTQGSISVPSAVSSSSGPSSTTYKGVSSSAGSTTSVTPTTANTKYYAHYQATITATFYYYDGSAQASTTASGTRKAKTDGTTYSTVQGSISVPSAVSSSGGPNSTTYKGVSKSTGSTTAATPTTANTKYYAYYQATITATFYYYDGSAQASATASGTRTAKTNGTTYSTTQGSISVPSAVTTNSNGQNSTIYKGVSASTNSTTAATPTTANTKYYAYYQADYGATFYYYNGSAQATTIATGTRSCKTNGTTYSTTEGSISVPSAVSSSTGPNSATYKGVSISTSSTTSATPTTANEKYYAYYQGSWKASYAKGTGVSAIGATSNSCTNYKTTNGTTYSSSTCSITLPTITLSSNYQNASWYNGSSVYGSAGAKKTLSSDISLTAKATLIICKRATTLHTGTCNNSGGTATCSGYGLTPYKTDGITFGSLGSSGSYSVGNAFDCDVNGDGTYDSTTERFYYISKSSSRAYLIYYMNTVSGVGSSSGSNYIPYNTNPQTVVYSTAKTYLPTTSQWTNVSLENTTIDIPSTMDGGPTNTMSLSGYSARMIQRDEVWSACGISSDVKLPSKCYFLYENTAWHNTGRGYWLVGYVKGSSASSAQSWALAARYATSNTDSFSYFDLPVTTVSLYGVRPVIEVPLANMAN